MRPRVVSARAHLAQKFKLVALTGWGQEKDRRLTHDAGFDLHLMKPLDLDQLSEVLQPA